MLIANPISDLLIRIKNAYAVGHGSLDVPFSKFKHEVAKILEREGYIKSALKKKKIKNRKTYIQLHIKLEYENGKPKLQGIKITSKPSRALYVKKRDIRPVKSGLGHLILTTSKGVMTDVEAVKRGMGGQTLAEIW